MPLSATAGKHSSGTAGAKPEEGAGHGRSVYFERCGLSFPTLYFSRAMLSYIRQIRKNEQMMAYLAGLVIGDGHIEKKGRLVIATSNREFLLKISSMIKFNKSVFYDKSAGVWKIALYSKEFIGEIKSFGVLEGNKTKADMKICANKNEAALLISGLYDAEGHCEINHIRGYLYGKIRIKMMNTSIMRFVYGFLRAEGYEPRIYEKDKCIVVDVNKQRNAAKFLCHFILFHPKWGKLRNHLSEAEGLNFHGLHAAYNAPDNGMRPRKGKPIS